jgi:VCBS repeat-containing protein
MSNEQNRGTPILSLADVAGVQSTPAINLEVNSDVSVTSESGSKESRSAVDETSVVAPAHGLTDAETLAPAFGTHHAAILLDAADGSSDASGASSASHPLLDGTASTHSESFVFANVVGHDAVQLNDSFASLDVVHNQLGASAPDFSAAATNSPLWSENLLAAHLRQGSLGHNTEFQGGSHNHGGPPPATLEGQLWAADDGDTSGNPDGHGSDARLEHMDSDGVANDQVDAYSITSTGAFISVGLDTAANLYFAEDNQDHFYVGHISNGANLTTTTIASTSDLDVTNSFVVDPALNTIFMDLDGGDYHADGGDIIKITYNANGTISSPYNPGTFAINLNNVLVDSTSSGGIYQDGRAFALSSDGSTLYYVDDDDNNPSSAFSASTNGIYRISTTGDVGHGTAPTPVLLSNQAQFPVDDSNGFITGIAVNQAQGIIYFTTDASGEGVNTSQDAVWWMPIGGGTATQMSMPGGVSLDYASFFSENLAFDPGARTLYVADQQQDHILQLTLSADGKSFTSGNNNFYTTDTNGADGASTYALTFASLATESSLTGTSTQVVQGGSAVSLLTATPTISDPQGTYIGNLAGFTVEVIGGTKGDGTSFGVTSGALAGAAGLSGDNLYINGQQSGTLDGGQVTVSWNNSTQTLTLSGDVSDAEYKTLLSEVTFQENAGTDTTSGSHPTRVIDFIANDGVTVIHPTTNDPNEQQITVTLDRAPTVVTESNSVLESASGSGTSGTGGTGGLASDSDLDGDSLTIIAVAGSAGNVGAAVAGTYGSLTLNADGSYTYNASNTSAINSAATGSHPVDTFTYTVSDGHGGTTTQTINIAIDRPPVANNASATDFAGATDNVGAGSGVLSIDSDPDGDSLTVTAVAGSGANVGISIAGTYGHLTLNANGSYSYIADNSSAINGQPDNAVLTDTFSYTASDGHGGTSTANLVITVDQAPTVTSLGASATSSANFATAHTVTFTLDVGKNVTVAGGTTLSLSDGGTATYVSGSGTQTLIFTYSATDAPTSLTVSSVASGSLADAAGNPLAIAGTSVSPYTDAVTDSAANVAANFVSLDSAVSYISSITLNDGGTPNLDLTASEIVNDQTLIGKIVSSYSLVANDTASAIGTNFDSLETYASSISAVVFTDGGTPTLDLTQTQVTNDATLLAKVQGPYDLLVTGVTGHAYTSYQNDYNASNKLTETTDFNTNGSETFYGYVAGLTFIGTAQGDTFYLQSAPNVTASGDAGTDLFFFGSGFSSSDQITGGTGANTLELDGTYTGGNALTISTSMMSGIQTLLLAKNHSYNITLDAGVVSAGKTLTVSATTLGSSDSLTFNGSALTAGTLVIAAGAGANDLTGGAGTNDFIMGANLTASDEINGGTGITSVHLNGDYSGGLTFTSTTMVNVDAIALTAGHSYDLVLNSATIGSGHTMTIEGSSLGASDNMTIDGSALTTGTLVIVGGAGTDILTGGAGTNTFDMGAFLTASDQINGGTGTTAVHLDGDYSGGLLFGATTMTNVSSLNLAAGHSYDLIMNAATVGSGQTLSVQGGTLGAGDSLDFNGSPVTDGGKFIIHGGAGTNTLIGGSGNDTIYAGSGTSSITGGGGTDLLIAGSGADTFNYVAVGDSTSTTHDTIAGFNTSLDMIALLNGLSGVTVVDTAVTTGNLSNSGFDASLAQDIGAAQLSAHGAVLFTPNSGGLAGHTFLIIDENGVAGYQASQDIVIQLTGGVGLGSLSTANFET